MALEWIMLSMVNANRFINTAVIPLVILAYGVFLLIDHGHRNPVDAASRDHIQSIQKIGRIDGLLFGGSNSKYSLSAEALSYSMGTNWYNASVMGEFGNSERYKNFIRDLSAFIDRTKVRYVVYSTIAPYHTGIIAWYKSRDLGKGIKPKISVLRYTRHHLFRDSSQRNRSDSDFPQPNRFGDAVFENENCDFTTKSVVKHQREDEDISVEFLVDYAIFLASLFPNASILIVLPSEYYDGALSFDDSLFEQTLRTKFYSVLDAKYSKNTIIKIIFQTPYSSITQVCDLPFHANEDGRRWRTRNLIEFMREIVPSNRAMTHAW
jgi:hypothetical protein